MAIKSAQDWDAEFRAGKYGFLHRPVEQRRLDAIAGMIGQVAARHGRVEVADIGSGEGLLLARLEPRNVARYIAVDLSAVALGAIAPREGIEVERIACGLAQWQGEPPSIAPRVLVASEVLYYEPQGVAHLERLAGGKDCVSVIVSCVAGRPDKPNWTQASQALWTDLAATGWRRAQQERIADAQADLAWDVVRFATGE